MNISSKLYSHDFYFIFPGNKSVALENTLVLVSSGVALSGSSVVLVIPAASTTFLPWDLKHLKIRMVSLPPILSITLSIKLICLVKV